MIGATGNGETPTPDPPQAEPLGRAERAIAVAVGLAAGGGGGYAVFVSSNQAGTAILLILATIFLLVGIQGTSLIRFSTGTNTVELERRKRVERALKEAAQEPDLERAEGIVEGIAIAQPSLPSLPEAQGLLYQRRLQLAITALGYEPSDVRLDYAVDFMVRNRQGQTIAVEAKYAAPGKRAYVGSQEIARADRSSLPVLFVANVAFTSVARQYPLEEKGTRVKLVTWRDERDNDVLRGALAEMFAGLT